MFLGDAPPVMHLSVLLITLLHAAHELLHQNMIVPELANSLLPSHLPMHPSGY